MIEETFNLKFVHSKDCFLYLSDKWYRKLINSKFSALKLSSKNKEYFFTWATQPMRLNDCTVGINATFAQGLNLIENDLVILKAVETIPIVHRVFMTPLTQDDYDILTVSRSLVENSLLNQVQVIFSKQILTVWVSKSMHLKLHIDELESNELVGRLQQFTELVIGNSNYDRGNGNKKEKMNSNHTEVKTNEMPKSNENKNSFWGSFSQYLNTNILGIQSEPNLNVSSKSDSSNVDSSLNSFIFRTHPIKSLENEIECCKNVHDQSKNPYNIFITKNSLPKCFREENSSGEIIPILCKISIVPFKVKLTEKSSSKLEDLPTSSNNSEVSSKNISSDSICVRLYCISDHCQKFPVVPSRTRIVFVTTLIQQFMKLSIGSKIKLTKYIPKLDTLLCEIYITPTRKSKTHHNNSKEDDLTKKFSNNLLVGHSHLLNNNAPFPIQNSEGSISYVVVKLIPHELNCWPLTLAELQVCPIIQLSQRSEIFKDFVDPFCDENTTTGDKTFENHPEKLKCFSNILDEAMISLELDLGFTTVHSPCKYNVLITGKHGSGKTKLSNYLCNYFREMPYFVHVIKVDCKQLHNKTVDSLAKTLSNAFTRCVYFQPSLLLFDDLDTIAGVVKDSNEMSAKSSHYFRVADLIYNLMNSIKDSCVSVIGTALSHTTINAQIISARGCNAFNTILSIPLLNKADRLTIIKELFLQHDNIIDTHEILDSLTSIAIMTEGYVERDLDSLVKKSIFYAMERTRIVGNSKYNVLMEDVQKALENTVPYDLINVNVTKGSDFSWEDIGGLHEAKKVLTEALIWPSKYGEVFDTCPLRNERGVLLYGLPGTGKTLLAKAVAGQCGFNFISVKGPELLSKYIGASEEAVRNIFQKAQNAKPCILFFDEFDSLAPRRGHDNTGVTDRVVNQLLTNLDGVETLEGVWVLASTSRPDLLDPALLRPGRIGTFIYCSLPNATERLEILKKLSRTLCFTADVNFEAIAEQTNCFTAPDIKALLYTALTLVTNQSECIMNDRKNTENSKIDKATITQEILLSALNVTKPYLQKSDRDRLLKTYDIFDKRRTGSREVIDISAQHITLA